MKKNLHFVYAFPDLKNPWKRIDSLLSKLFGFNLKEKYFSLRNWPKPIQAPLSISFNVCKSFSEQYNVFVYDIHDNRDLFLGNNDIFLGHAWPDFKDYKSGNNYWKTFDPDNITNKVILRYPNDPRVNIIMPFNHSMEQNGWLEPLLDKIHTFIGIAGDYWVNNLPNFPLATKINNFNQLNMAINRNDYPLLKISFNKKNNRKYLYIGRVSKEKNIEFLEKMALTPDFIGGYISDGNYIKGWKKISDFRSLTPDYVQSLVREYDFFVTASTYDAQATTILEAMSWGFMILCTEQSGYSHDSMFLLDINDFELNKSLLDSIQNLDDKVFFEKQDINLNLLDTKYSWGKFNKDLHNVINKKSNL